LRDRVAACQLLGDGPRRQTLRACRAFTPTFAAVARSSTTCANRAATDGARAARASPSPRAPRSGASRPGSDHRGAYAKRLRQRIRRARGPAGTDHDCGLENTEGAAPGRPGAHHAVQHSGGAPGHAAAHLRRFAAISSFQPRRVRAWRGSEQAGPGGRDGIRRRARRDTQRIADRASAGTSAAGAGLVDLEQGCAGPQSSRGGAPRAIRLSRTPRARKSSGWTSGAGPSSALQVFARHLDMIGRSKSGPRWPP